MAYYKTLDYDEYKQMENVLKNYWGEKIKYKNKIFRLSHIDNYIYEIEDSELLQKIYTNNGFCLLIDEDGNTIQVSIREVYDSVLKML